MLDIAKKTKDTMSWIIRFHPLMAEYCIDQGVFHDINEWNLYVREWEKLDNAKVSINGDYYDIFKTSDGMVMDSISFLPVYQQLTRKMN